MRQAIMTSPGKIVFQNIEKPKPGPGEVLLKIKRIGVCGSDVHVWHGKHPYTSYPVIQGHEFSATLVGLGDGVTNFKVGSLVTATPQEVCGVCGPCRRGDYHICDQLKVRGFQAPGVAQDYFITQADKIVSLPENFSLEQGAFVEPVSVAVHSTQKAGEIKNKNVVVLGAGPIGNLIAQSAKAGGANVLITDISEYRLEIAKKCGIQNISNSRIEKLKVASKRVFGEKGFSVAFECVGIEETMSNVIESIEKGGTVVVVGVFGEKPRVDLGLVQDRELKLVGTLMYKYEDYVQATKSIENGSVILEPLFSKHFKFENYNEAYNFIDQQGERSMKVFIDL